jgi:hypothetical protein
MSTHKDKQQYILDSAVLDHGAKRVEIDSLLRVQGGKEGAQQQQRDSKPHCDLESVSGE